MKVEGNCNGEVILHSDLQSTFDYLSDHEKILLFNPLCKRVTPTGLDNVYQWDFEVSDPKGHPMKLIFFVEQTEEHVLHLPDQHHNGNGHSLPEHQAASNHKIGNKIIWKEYPVKVLDKMPDERTFLGRAKGLMDMKKIHDNKTQVAVNISVHIDFDLPRLFKIFPEPIFKAMAETAVAISMQNVSKKMLDNISRDFHCQTIGDTNMGTAKMR